MNGPGYHVKPAVDDLQKGLAVYSRRSFQREELIFAEKPLLFVPSRAPEHFMRDLWRIVAKDISSHPIGDAFRSLSREKQKDFLRLHNSRQKLLTRAEYYPPNVEREFKRPTCNFELLGIYLTNFYFLSDDRTGVFNATSRINHSCFPNSYLDWDPKLRVMSVRAARKIEKADVEITIDYSEKFRHLIFSSTDDLRVHCRYFYGFWCRCESCIDGILRNSIRVVRPNEERIPIEVHLDELQERLLLKQEQPSWEIRQHPDHPSGFGMFAMRKIQKGEPILGESPMIALGLDIRELGSVTGLRVILPAIQAMCEEEREAYLALKNDQCNVSEISATLPQDVLTHKTVNEIFVSNAISLPKCSQKHGVCEWGVFRHLSRVNNSCSSNAVGITYDRRLWGVGVCEHWLHSRRDIEPGEEITICYTEWLCTEPDVAVRASFLGDRLTCWCLKCQIERQGKPWIPSGQDAAWYIDYQGDSTDEYARLWRDTRRVEDMVESVPGQAVARMHNGEAPEGMAGTDNTLQQLVSNDCWIGLNEIPGNERITISAKRAGKRIAKTIYGLPSAMETVKYKIGLKPKIKDSQDYKLKRGDKRHQSGSCGVGDSTAPRDWGVMKTIVLGVGPEVDTESEGSWSPKNKTCIAKKAPELTVDLPQEPSALSSLEYWQWDPSGESFLSGSSLARAKNSLASADLFGAGSSSNSLRDKSVDIDPLSSKLPQIGQNNEKLPPYEQPGSQLCAGSMSASRFRTGTERPGNPAVSERLEISANYRMERGPSGSRPRSRMTYGTGGSTSNSNHPENEKPLPSGGHFGRNHSVHPVVECVNTVSKSSAPNTQLDLTRRSSGASAYIAAYSRDQGNERQLIRNNPYGPTAGALYPIPRNSDYARQRSSSSAHELDQQDTTNRAPESEKSFRGSPHRAGEMSHHPGHEREQPQDASAAADTSATIPTGVARPDQRADSGQSPADTRNLCSQDLINDRGSASNGRSPSETEGLALRGRIAFDRVSAILAQPMGTQPVVGSCIKPLALESDLIILQSAAYPAELTFDSPSKGGEVGESAIQQQQNVQLPKRTVLSDHRLSSTSDQMSPQEIDRLTGIQPRPSSQGNSGQMNNPDGMLEKNHNPNPLTGSLLVAGGAGLVGGTGKAA